jgi:predicted ATPase
VVALVGEAGVGKSRLVHEVVHSHRTQGWRVLESASVSYGKAMPYYPIIELLKRYAHVEERDDTRTIRAKVTAPPLVSSNGRCNQRSPNVISDLRPRPALFPPGAARTSSP